MDDETRERRAWTVPEREGRFQGLELSRLDPSDPDDRRLLIVAEHPDIAAAMERDEDEVLIGGEPVSTELHIAMHQIAAAQLWDDDPPEMWQTAKRLRELGYDRHEILHMLAGTVADQTFRMLRDQREYDRREHIEALDALPESWEEQRES